MAVAGMTHGGFYGHFASKEQLVADSLAFGMESLVEWMRRTVSALPGDRGLQVIIAHYLSIQLRDDVARGCSLTALGSQLVHSSDTVRATATTGFLNIVNVIAGQLGDRTPATARKDALAMLSMMIGAATMARIVTDSDLSISILHEARKRLSSP